MKYKNSTFFNFTKDCKVDMIMGRIKVESIMNHWSRNTKKRLNVLIEEVLTVAC